MHISKLNISGYKPFNEEFAISLNKGINVLVGENGSGKSAIIDALRLILLEDEYGRAGVSESDFNRPFKLDAKPSEFIKLSCQFNGLSENEQVAYLPWLDLTDPTRAFLNLQIENKEDSRGRYKRKMWGGQSSSGIFEWELLEAINCIYLPPLRDAEERLRAYRGSRLARLFKNLNKETLLEDEPHELERTFTKFAEDLQKDKKGTIYKTNRLIRENLIKAIGTVFGQDTLIQFSETNFARIVESLRLLYFPTLLEDSDEDSYRLFRELNENSLGYNNLIYLATVLAEFEGLKQDSQTLFKILLIEEPEAHLHPQLQTRLLQHLQSLAEQENIQVIVSSHSPTIAASVSLGKIVILTLQGRDKNPIPTCLSECGLSKHGKFFLERWLDITKSTLLFAKGVILVEGIAEALVVPELAGIVIRGKISNSDKRASTTLKDYGVSIINMDGIYFNHFMQLFKGYFVNDDGQKESKDFIPVRCVGITDCDPDKKAKPTCSEKYSCHNPAIRLINELKNHSETCRLYANLKTFEYDLAIEDNNLSLMSNVLIQLIPTHGDNKQKAQEFKSTDWRSRNENDKAEAAFWLLETIENYSEIGKGRFAQKLAYQLSCKNLDFTVPKYIEDAVRWVIGKEDGR